MYTVFQVMIYVNLNRSGKFMPVNLIKRAHAQAGSALLVHNGNTKVTQCCHVKSFTGWP